MVYNTCRETGRSSWSCYYCSKKRINKHTSIVLLLFASHLRSWLLRQRFQVRLVGQSHEIIMTKVNRVLQGFIGTSQCVLLIIYWTRVDSYNSACLLPLENYFLANCSYAIIPLSLTQWSYSYTLPISLLVPWYLLSNRNFFQFIASIPLWECAYLIVWYNRL